MSRCYQSKYGILDPSKFSKPFSQIEHCRKAIANLKEEHSITILCDFVWMHVDRFEGKGNEYKLNKLIKAATKLLDTKKGYGFGGLRIDAVSHMDSEVRVPLLLHIKKKYPDAIIFEEVLFDDNQAENVKALAVSAEKNNAFSDFVTSNLYYRVPDEFGALPHAEDMGDKIKLKLAENHAISFTGNHDHYSLAWGIVMRLAAKRFLEDNNSSFRQKIEGTTIYPNNYRPFKSFNNLRGTIKSILKGKITPESVSADSQNNVTQFLYPFAVEIAKELYDGSNEALFQQFKNTLFETMVNRTLASPSGYFMLHADLSASLRTPCIFSNKNGNNPELFLISAKDLLVYLDLLEKIERQMTKIKGASKFKNLTNFKRQSSILNSEITKNPGETLNDALLFLPYFITHLRACYPFSDDNLNAWLDERKITTEKEEAFAKKLSIVDFIKSINTIFSKLTTYDSHDYHTFVSLDLYKIIIRCSEKSTDIIIINLNSDKTMTVDMIDIQKIAIWFQSRMFPASEETAKKLSAPFERATKADGSITYSTDVTYHEDNYASEHTAKETEFDASYTRITGELAEHQTNLYTGLGLNIDEEILSGDNNINVLVQHESRKPIESRTPVSARATTTAPGVAFFPAEPAASQTTTTENPRATGLQMK